MTDDRRKLVEAFEAARIRHQEFRRLGCYGEQVTEWILECEQSLGERKGALEALRAYDAEHQERSE
jgi:hypothetical protein